MENVASPTIWTVGPIARELGRPIHAIEYIIRARGIRSIGKAGNARIYDQAAYDQIAAEIRRIESTRSAAPKLAG